MITGLFEAGRCAVSAVLFQFEFRHRNGKWPNAYQTWEAIHR
ncbi:Uncharacterised protein [Mycobacteroides abscessus subsp. abscessus]|nr:Uncharacterised protein [Mycobacteroides abscessus subsp. abscessus]